MDFQKSLTDLGVSIFNSHRIFSKYIPSMLLSSTLALGVFSPQFSIAEEMVIEEIIVTAQKREQSIQDVPISISAFNEEFLNNAGVDDVLELQFFVPGLTILIIKLPLKRILIFEGLEPQVIAYRWSHQ